MVNSYDLQQALGIDFEDPSLLEQALVHSSYSNENPDLSLADNERFEFLGDALLNFVVAEKLYREFPNLAEGELTEMRSSLIRRETLAEIASTLNLGDYLYMGRGEESKGGRNRDTNLADTFESLVAAIFLDGGLPTARDFILTNLQKQLERVTAGEASPNYKALLQELTQGTYKQLPAYRLLDASGPDHDKQFTVEVTLGDSVVGVGSGRSKQAAETEAARRAWEKLQAD